RSSALRRTCPTAVRHPPRWKRSSTRCKASNAIPPASNVRYCPGPRFARRSTCIAIVNPATTRTKIAPTRPDERPILTAMTDVTETETLPNEEEVRSALKSVYDPEIGISIIDLGLVYGVQIDDDSKNVIIDMTLTTPACP